MIINKHNIERALAAAEKPVLVQHNDHLLEAEESWSKSPVLGVDTEFLRERTYRAELGLVQVSDGETAWLVDPISLDNLDPVRRMFENTLIIKALHSASEDLEVLWTTLGAVPEPMVDTQVACAMLGQSLQLSYQNAVQWLFDLEIDKEQTRSNWIRRPLKKVQLHYAAMDVVLLPMMYQQLRSQLKDEDRWHWVGEDVELMIRQSKESLDPRSAFLRIKGIGRLKPAALKTIQVLATWREETARARNLARGFVLPDSVLMQVAQRQPQQVNDLKDIEGIHPRALEKYRQDLLRLVQQSRELSEPIEPPAPLDSSQRRLLINMRDAVKEKADEMGIDPALLASKKFLEALLRQSAAGEPPPERLAGWRYPVITETLTNLAADAARR